MSFENAERHELSATTAVRATVRREHGIPFLEEHRRKPERASVRVAYAV
jgi:hypothetical protein